MISSWKCRYLKTLELDIEKRTNRHDISFYHLLLFLQYNRKTALYAILSQSFNLNPPPTGISCLVGNYLRGTIYMAGFLYKLKKLLDKDLEQSLKSLPMNLEISYTDNNSLFSIFDSLSLYKPLHLTEFNISIYCFGKPTIEKEIYESFKDRTSLSNKLILDNFINGGIDKVALSLSGAATIIIKHNNIVHLVTDRLGYVPTFIYNPEDIDNCIVSSSPNTISSIVDTNIDLVSVSEFLHYHKCTPPHTFYKEIKYAGAATIHTWNLETNIYSVDTYWEPFKLIPFNNLKEAVEETTKAIKKAIKNRTYLPNVSTFTSGGLDSRLVLYAADNPENLTAFNLYDELNNENEVAHLLCKDTKVPLVGLQRDKDYYPRTLKDSVKYSEGMWSIYDSHFLGFRDEIVYKYNAQSVLSSCSADFLFKECGIDRKHPKILGWVAYYWYVFANPPVINNNFNNYIDPPVDIFTPLAKCLHDRLNAWFGPSPKEVSDKYRLYLADKRCRPLCYSAGLSFNTMFRIFPYDNFLSDLEVINCYDRMKADWRINAKLWRKVVTNICGTTVRNANNNLKPDFSFIDFLLDKTIFSSKFKTKDYLTPSLANTTSWPTFTYYLKNSQLLHEIWLSITPLERELIDTLYGYVNWYKPLEFFTESEERKIFRILSLIVYMRGNYKFNKFRVSPVKSNYSQV